MVATRVDTGPMLSASARLRSAGEACAGDAAAVQAAFGVIARGAGDARVATAGAGASTRWGAALGKCSMGLMGFASAVGGAAGSYDSCEASNGAMFGARR